MCRNRHWWCCSRIVGSSRWEAHLTWRLSSYCIKKISCYLPILIALFLLSAAAAVVSCNLGSALENFTYLLRFQRQHDYWVFGSSDRYLTIVVSILCFSYSSWCVLFAKPINCLDRILRTNWQISFCNQILRLYIFTNVVHTHNRISYQ